MLGRKPSSPAAWVEGLAVTRRALLTGLPLNLSFKLFETGRDRGISGVLGVASRSRLLISRARSFVAASRIDKTSF